MISIRHNAGPGRTFSINGTFPGRSRRARHRKRDGQWSLSPNIFAPVLAALRADPVHTVRLPALAKTQKLD